MNFLAILFFVLFIIGTISTLIAIPVEKSGGDTFPKITIGIFLGFFIPTLFFWVLNLFCFPGKETRYVPDTRIAWSVDGVNTIENISDLPVEQPIYLQIRISVEANSFARRFFHDNRIPVTVTISNPDIAEYQLQLSRDFEQTAPPSSDNNATNFYFAVYATKGGFEEALITLKGEAKKAGTQTVRIHYDRKVSGKHERVATLTYQEDE